MPVNQPDNVQRALEELVSGIDGWQLGCGYRAVTLGSSFVLGYAFLQRKISANSLFDLCFLDELYQNKKWGLDEEAALRHTNIRSELKDLESILSML
jgi:chaperone required for assembly of F1-ATPase